MSYKIKGDQITLTRGDTLLVTLIITDGRNAYTPMPGDVIRFAMSKKYKSKAGYELLLVRPIPTDTLVLELQPEDTATLNYGTYNYDIQITRSDGRVDTFISSTITLTEEVE